MPENKLGNLTIIQFLERLAAPHFPGPAAGSAAATGGAVAAAMLELACNVTLTKQKDHPKLKGHLEKAGYLRKVYLSLADEDVEAYGEVIKAAKRKQENPQEFEQAMKWATDTLVALVTNSKLLLMEIREVVDICNKKVMGDLICGVHLADAVAIAAKKGAEINVCLIADQEFREKTLLLANEAYGICRENKELILSITR